MANEEKKLKGAKFIATYTRRMNVLREMAQNDTELEAELEKSHTSGLFRQFAVFLSVTDSERRAEVFVSTDITLNLALAQVSEIAARHILENGVYPLWLKLDVMTNAEVISYEQFRTDLYTRRSFNFRYGISLDSEFRSALLCDQLTAGGLVDYIPDGSGYRASGLKLTALGRYYSRRMPVRGYEWKNEIPKQVIKLSCKGYFSEENAAYKLFSNKDDYGRRIIPFTRELLSSTIESSCDYLLRDMTKEGMFRYCTYPISGNILEHYNIIRHIASIAAFFAGDYVTDGKRHDEFMEAAKQAVSYFDSEITYDSDGNAFVIDRDPSEIKLGASGNAIILLAKYDEMAGTTEHTELIRKFADGILKLQQDDGSYYHVLNADFTEKEKNRVVYYDGEAAYALACTYGITKEPKYLEAAEKSVKYFIANNYEQYIDHWVAYTMAEITKYAKKPEYFAFALKNAQDNFKAVYDRDTSFHTYLEMLMQTFITYKRMKDENIAVDYKFDEERFFKTINRRAYHMLNGYLFPEIAMYTRFPAICSNTFMVRHQNYRVRIDDIEHFVGGYVEFCRYFDEVYKPELYDENGIYIGKY